MMSKYVEEKWERKGSGMVHVERVRTEVKVVKSRLRWETFLPPRPG